MAVPYEPALIARLLGGMTDARLATVTPITFQTWPARKVAKASVIAELIANERAARRPRNGAGAS